MARSNKSISYKKLLANFRDFYANRNKYVYWYGGKDKKCTANLLNQLAKSYPNIYTIVYYNRAKLDIKNNKYCIDCSGLVCKIYNIPDIGTEQFGSHFTEYHGTIKDLMIVYRKGHCGIYYQGRVLEAKGLYYDIQFNKFNRTDWTKCYYDPNIKYATTADKVKTVESELMMTAIECIYGKYGNGDQRTYNLTKLGYGTAQQQEIQSKINTIYANAKLTGKTVDQYLRDENWIK